jgi:hypothetical protein
MLAYLNRESLTALLDKQIAAKSNDARALMQATGKASGSDHEAKSGRGCEDLNSCQVAIACPYGFDR